MIFLNVLIYRDADCIYKESRIFKEEYSLIMGKMIPVNIYKTGIQIEMIENFLVPRLSNDGCEKYICSDDDDQGGQGSEETDKYKEKYEKTILVMRYLLLGFMCICGVFILIILIQCCVISCLKKKMGKSLPTKKKVNSIEMQ